MAKNLFEVVQNLLLPFVLFAFAGSVVFHLEEKRIRKWFSISSVVLFVFVIIVSVLRHWRFIRYNQINNIYLLNSSLALGLALLVLLWVTVLSKPKALAFEIILASCALLYSACLFLYKVPTVIFLPLQYMGVDENIFTTMYLLKVTGFLLGVLCCILTCVALYNVLCRSGIKTNAAAFSMIYLLNGFISFVAVVGIINSYYRRKIKIPLGLRKKIPALITWENIAFFIVIFVLIALAAIFIIRHVRIHGEYNNPAELRKLKRYERDSRRWGILLLVLGVFSLVDMTLIKKKANSLVQLSPSEEFQIDGNRIFIPLVQVSDGHLHRFSWTNQKGKTVRFIIVQKKGTNFGIGFDACEVCGNVGYYERKNEVVCNRCDVVMNKNTIGLKGGCNPIPLESRIEDGGIVIFTEDLDRESGRF